MEFGSFPYPTAVARLVCCDLDETYRPIDGQTRLVERGNVRELERFMAANAQRLGLVFGWVTGSSIKAVMRKAEDYSTALPHFIASSLGSELYWVRDGRPVACPQWAERIRSTGFSHASLQRTVDDLTAQGVSLWGQHEDYQGEFMGCYYYTGTGDDGRALAAIDAAAQANGLRAFVSRCNPAAGDPEGYYDVHLLPTCCGKGEVVDFLCGELGVDRSMSWAFGDSCNDMEMLRSAANGYLVGNADRAAVEIFPQVLELPYCRGILSVLEKL